MMIILSKHDSYLPNFFLFLLIAKLKYIVQVAVKIGKKYIGTQLLILKVTKFFFNFENCTNYPFLVQVTWGTYTIFTDNRPYYKYNNKV